MSYYKLYIFCPVLSDASGILTFDPGDVSKTIEVTIKGDLLNETSETFQVELFSPIQATLATARATATIQNDDPFPSLSVRNVSILEGDDGVSQALFIVSLSAASGQTVSLNYATVDDTAQVSDNDYEATSGVLTFAPGDIQKSISVSVPADRKRELDETFRLNLTNPTAATIATGEAVGTITNDDPLPSLSINSISLKEGNRGPTTALLTVSLSAVSSQSVSVEYATVDGTATLAEGDYQFVTQTLTFAPGETSKTIPVLINGDLTVEPNETFSLTLVNPENATLDQARGTVTLENDDIQPGSLPQSSAGQNLAASSSANTVKAEQVTGDATDNQIQGGAGDDRLDGAAGDDIISGGDGDDILYGREGNDRLLGGDGDDTLYGGRTQDEVTGGQGKDLLYGGRGDDLLVGSAGGDELYGREGNDRLLGKQGDDFLGGGTGRDQLTGGIGQDRLRGGKGRDQFQFFKLEEQGDWIGDFSVKQDLLVVSAGGFAGLKTGSLRQNQFQLGQTALDAEDRFIYNGATGALYFDADGSGSSQQILLATFSNRAALSFEAVRIVA